MPAKTKTLDEVMKKFETILDKKDIRVSVNDIVVMEDFFRSAIMELMNDKIEKGKVFDLLDNCYDAIAKAIYTDDGLDGLEGEELCKEIKDMIGETELIKEWENTEEEN